MNRFVDNVSIQNFKSLGNVRLDDCRSYNLLLGRPNVGKSNILEALSLFAVPFASIEKQPLSQLIRYRHSISELYHDGNITQPITVTAGNHQVTLESTEPKKSLWRHTDGQLTEELIINGKVSQRKTETPIFKKYTFRGIGQSLLTDYNFLLPIQSQNLMHVIQQHPQLSDEFSRLLSDYGLRMLFDTSTREIRLMKNVTDSVVFSIPLSSVSDTLQRLLFYKTIVSSNTSSVIMLEEIEAHSYPPYISKITHTILGDHSNQYFITTHSPYVVNDFLESTDNDVAVYLVDYQQGETIVRRLTDAELQQVYDNGIDMFFTIDNFFQQQ